VSFCFWLMYRFSLWPLPGRKSPGPNMNDQEWCVLITMHWRQWLRSKRSARSQRCLTAVWAIVGRTQDTRVVSRGSSTAQKFQGAALYDSPTCLMR